MATAPPSTLTSPVESSIADSQLKDVIVIDDDDDDDDEAVSVERRLTTGSSPDAVVKKEDGEEPTVTNGHVREDQMDVDDLDVKPLISSTTTAPAQKPSSTAQSTTAPAVVPIPEAPQTVQIPSADDHHDQHYQQQPQAVPQDLHQQQQQQQKIIKTKKPKEDSPPPQLPPRPPPIPTIRLEFFPDEESEDGYLFDVLGLSKLAGQRLPTPPPVDRDSSDSDDDDEPPEAPLPLPMPIEPLPGAFPTRRRRKKQIDYDLDDPFIDDEELAINERTHFAQTTQTGFYVSRGDVDLIEDPSAPIRVAPMPMVSSVSAQPMLQLAPDMVQEKRPTGRPPRRAPVNATMIAQVILNRPLGSGEASVAGHMSEITEQARAAAAAAAAALVNGHGTKDSPITLGDEADASASAGGASGSTPNDKKRKASPKEKDDPKKKRKTNEVLPFSPAMKAEFASLEHTIMQFSFEQKGKFPPELKPRLTASAVRSIQLNEYGDNFFNQLPRLFPYNRYTMFKLTKRLVYAEHVKMIVERQDQLLEELGKMVNEGMEGAQAEYDRALNMWEEKREKRKRESLVAPPEVQSAAFSPASAPVHMEEDKKEGEEKEHEEGEEGEKEDKDKPPQKRFRLSEPMKGLIWALVVLNNEIVALSNEKNSLEGSAEVVSEQSQRKALYQKIMPLFPDGWMNTGYISREVSIMKKKFESLNKTAEESTTVKAAADK